MEGTWEFKYSTHTITFIFDEDKTFLNHKWSLFYDRNSIRVKYFGYDNVCHTRLTPGDLTMKYFNGQMLMNGKVTA